MEISLASSDTIRIVSGSAETTLSRASFGIDGMMVDMPGEYEKSGILLTVGRFGESLFAHLVIEGRSIGYLDAPVVEADERLSEFL
ncbi:MAG TPA: hypothetical protein PK765_05585 [bacterium]|nr:hypothetical protein [bacterium]